MDLSRIDTITWASAYDSTQRLTIFQCGECEQALYSTGEYDHAIAQQPQKADSLYAFVFQVSLLSFNASATVTRSGSNTLLIFAISAHDMARAATSLAVDYIALCRG